MRKTIVTILFTLCMILTIQTAFAKEPIGVSIDNKTVYMEQAPMIIDDQLYVPIKPLAEGLKGWVFWEEENQVAHMTIGTTAISVQPGNEVATLSEYDPNGDAYINPTSIYLTAKPKVVDGTLMLTLNDLKYYVGVHALWDENISLIRVYSSENDPGYQVYKQQLEREDNGPIQTYEKTAYDVDGTAMFIGDTVTRVGFYGVIEDIEDGRILVNWHTKAPVMKDADVKFWEFASGVKYKGDSWVDANVVKLIQQP